MPLGLRLYFGEKRGAYMPPYRRGRYERNNPEYEPKKPSAFSRIVVILILLFFGAVIVYGAYTGIIDEIFEGIRIELPK